MDAKVKEQILAIRETGKTNMFDTAMVQRLAYDAGYNELVMYIEDDLSGYCNFIMYGD